MSDASAGFFLCDAHVRRYTSKRTWAKRKPGLVSVKYTGVNVVD
jgi:hypothetical protein